MDRRTSILLVLAIGIAWTLLDQWTKYLAVAHLTTLFPEDAGLWERLALFYGTDGLQRLATAPAQIIQPVWEHLYVQNPSGAFGLLGSLPLVARRIVLVTVAVAAAIFLLVLAGRTTGPGRTRMLMRVCMGLVLGGALGNNAFDRTIHGYVIDFIHWHWRTLSWPPFNIADVGIVVGAIGLFLLLWIEDRRLAAQERPEAQVKRRR